MTYNVMALDNVDPAAIAILENAAGIHLTAKSALTREETLAKIGEAHGLLIRSATKADAELIEAGTNLKAIARAGVGVDNVDLDAATARGIIVMNTPGGNTISTAEHTFGLMLALARFLPQGHASLAAGKWDRKSFVGVELKGKTLGLVGFGRIGRAIGLRAKAFEMTVIAYDPYVPTEFGSEVGIERVHLDELFQRADFISLHALVTDETRGLINAQNIAQMKKGVRILNAARGALINDHDLAEALKSGQVAGAALDVYEPEPPPADHPLLGLPNVIHTPHLAASTIDAQINVGIEAAELMVDALLRTKFDNVCNPAVLTK